MVLVNFRPVYFFAIIMIALTNLLVAGKVNSHLLENSKASFAQEYKELRILLQNVTDEQTAIAHKSAIQEQINKLKLNQAAGEQSFAAMSELEQKLFIKKFQNNRYHCGEVTQVMEERQRILLHPDLSAILRDVLNQIP